VLAYLFSSSGPATGVFESLASSIGAGLVVGGFVGGVRGLLVSRLRHVSEEGAVVGGYVGGAVGLALLLIDILGNLLSERMKRSFRNANFGIASSVAVLVVGTILFYDNEGAMELLALFAFAVAMGVLFFLDWRDERAQRKDAHRSS
jgi:hypothetical protein